MTLLDDVITGASGTAAVPTLLRQLKVISSRTGTGSLARWVSHELNGYTAEDDLPSYRGPFELIPLGHFVGPFQSEIRNVALPPITFPENLRESSLFKLSLWQSVSELEVLGQSEFTNISWPPDALVMYQHLLRAGKVSAIVQPMMTLADVRCPVAASVFIGALDAVRTRILDLALEIERVAPTAGESDAEPGEQARAGQVINNYFGASASVAISGPDSAQIVVSVPTSGDTEALVRFLAAAGLTSEQLSTLEAALSADLADEASDGAAGATHWTKTKAWFANAATDLGTSALGGALVTAAAGFFG